MSSNTVIKNGISHDNHKRISRKIRFIGNTGIKYLKDIEINGSFIVIEFHSVKKTSYPFERSHLSTK